jgi:hypothetical protein
MNISGPGNPLSPATQGLGVDDFRRSAQAGGEVRVQVDGTSFKLVATGQTPSGRSVAWVDGGGDTTRMFVEAMESAYGARLSQAVAHELGLRSAPGTGLPADQINQALTMAETAYNALDGVRFVDQLSLIEPKSKSDS